MIHYHRRGDHVNLGWTRIDRDNYVSTGAVPSECEGQHFYYIETWLFSSKPGASQHHVHATTTQVPDDGSALAVKAQRFHARYVAALRRQRACSLATRRSNAEIERLRDEVARLTRELGDEQRRQHDESLSRSFWAMGL